MIRRLNSLYALLPLTIVLGACTTDSDESVDPVTDPTPGFVAVFNPEFGQMPFPNDLFFSGTTDGTLNIPAGSDPSLEALNALDGYSTYAPIYVETTDAIDGDTVTYGVSVILVNAGTGAPAAADAHVAEYQNGSTVIEILPLSPLDPGTRYAVYVTKAVESTTGDNLAPSADFQGLVDLYESGAVPGTDLGDADATALYGAIGPLLAGADLSGIGAENLAIAWSFQTQSIGASLGAIEATADAAAEPAASGFMPLPKNGENYDAGFATTADVDERLAGHADVYIGAIELPYYSSIESPLSGFWTADAAPCQAIVNADDTDALSATPPSTTGFCPMPAASGTLAVPVLLTVPNASSALAGAINGVTIFQHGITGDRTNMLAAADALADAGQAVIAIDLPLHGLPTGHPLNGAENGLYAMTGIENITEPTFGLDVVDNETGAGGADGVEDTSGKHFINLASLLTSRDNLRQGVANLIHLVKAVPTMDYNAGVGGVGPDFDGLSISFAGQSLGAMTGVPFLAVNADVGPALLSVPGGGVAALLTQSPTFGPVIAAGLQQNGIVEGSRQFAEFMRNAQTAVDDGDPINYGGDAAAAHAIVMQEVIGGFGAGILEDQVIPNFATDALAAEMGLTQLAPGFYNNVGGVSGLVKFNQGSHSSLLDPSDSLEVTTEMQVEMASFIGAQGTQLAVGVEAAGGHPEVIDSP